jgi:hypothetical protein
VGWVISENTDEKYQSVAVIKGVVPADKWLGSVLPDDTVVLEDGSTSVDYRNWRDNNQD